VLFFNAYVFVIGRAYLLKRTGSSVIELPPSEIILLELVRGKLSPADFSSGMRGKFLISRLNSRQRVLWLSPQQGGEVLDALGKFHDFATSVEFELNFIIPGRSMINGLFKADERLYYLARQNEADPHTK
jgi:hypothetical protein